MKLNLFRKHTGFLLRRKGFFREIRGTHHKFLGRFVHSKSAVIAPLSDRPRLVSLISGTKRDRPRIAIHRSGTQSESCHADSIQLMQTANFRSTKQTLHSQYPSCHRDGEWGPTRDPTLTASQLPKLISHAARRSRLVHSL